MQRTLVMTWLLACLAAMWAAGEASAAAAEETEAEAGFRPIFDGRTLKGWHASAQTGHSRASGHKSGGRWVVHGGAIVGSQDIPGNGGIGLQLHGGGDFTKQYVRYRNLRVKRLDESK